ncbi:ABC transporter ATP-binding protein [Nevskia ramosa]|uniref:ABC transporter ATP-binding protein n=1 Tax=Nevskia ramosa TaxID=64002 RepID=UPI002353FE24|nr:nitrate/sulfonate/bicarbonate ABC transporter ATP-binding protein [Nevskia ramosa]
MNLSADSILLDLSDVCQHYEKGRDTALVVLDKVDLRLRRGEIVGLLGRSGSGKSTLLRIAAGLIRPSSGRVQCNGRPITGPVSEVAMVFQSFALFPWLTVLENVELGLEALGIDPAARHKRSLAAIQLIGLRGFESAYPRELSGGMRQRVGFARALVVHPQILLMDEPFSALDVLTAETLRTDLLDLWGEGQLPIKSILMVTHNIEEAVLMCDRILIFSSNPGRVIGEITVSLPQPRSRQDPSFRRLVDDIYTRMTARSDARSNTRSELFPGTGIGTVLPQISTNLLSGFIEALAAAPYSGRADLPALAEALQMPSDELLPIAETLQLLRFAELAEGDIMLSERGQRFAVGDPQARQQLFREHLISYVALAAHIHRVLDDRPSHVAPALRFQEELQDYMSAKFADTTLKAVIGWARYGNLFDYDEQTEMFALESVTT